MLIHCCLSCRHACRSSCSDREEQPDEEKHDEAKDKRAEEKKADEPSSSASSGSAVKDSSSSEHVGWVMVLASVAAESESACFCCLWFFEL